MQPPTAVRGRKDGAVEAAAKLAGQAGLLREAGNTAKHVAQRSTSKPMSLGRAAGTPRRWAASPVALQPALRPPGPRTSRALTRVV